MKDFVFKPGSVSAIISVLLGLAGLPLGVLATVDFFVWRGNAGYLSLGIPSIHMDVVGLVLGFMAHRRIGRAMDGLSGAELSRANTRRRFALAGIVLCGAALAAEGVPGLLFLMVVAAS